MVNADKSYDALRNNIIPIKQQNTAGKATASNGENPKTILAGPNKSWLVLKTSPITTPAKMRYPMVTSRRGPN